MDKIDKLVKKINPKHAHRIADTIEKIMNDDVVGMDIKKLIGHRDIFRVRVGEYRIIYKKTVNQMAILEISKRNDNTYRNY